MPDHPRRREDVVVDITSDDGRVLRTPDGNAVVLNATAYALWELCDGRTDPEEMAAGVMALFGLDETTARHDVVITLEALGDAGLLNASGS